MPRELKKSPTCFRLPSRLTPVPSFFSVGERVRGCRHRSSSLVYGSRDGAATTVTCCIGHQDQATHGTRNPRRVVVDLPLSKASGWDRRREWEQGRPWRKSPRRGRRETGSVVFGPSTYYHYRALSAVLSLVVDKREYSPAKRGKRTTHSRDSASSGLILHMSERRLRGMPGIVLPTTASTEFFAVNS